MALRGLRVIELAGLAPAPYCGMLLSDFGANVIRIEKPNQPPLDSLKRGKRTASIDLKHAMGRNIVKKLCTNADVLIEPFRPGVMERLGLGPDHLLDLNRRLIYARLSGFGQDGQYAKRAGHDLNYLAMSGVLSLFTTNGKPTAPINMLADFAGGGLTCAIGILLAVVERQQSGLGQVVDTSMVEGVRYVSTYMWHTRKPNIAAKSFIWPNETMTEANLLDGGAHFYTVYETLDKRWISVAAIEPQFYQVVLDVLGVYGPDFEQFDIERWPEFKKKWAVIFATKSLKEWTRLFDAAPDSCVEPVLELGESKQVAEQTCRPSFLDDGTPRPAPLLSRTPASPNLTEPETGEHTVEVLKEAGYSDSEIKSLSEAEVIQCGLKTKL